MRYIKYIWKFDGYAQDISLQGIKEEIEKSEFIQIELSKKEKIIKLNIRFGELFHKCSESEWIELLKYLDEFYGLPKPLFSRIKDKILKFFN